MNEQQSTLPTDESKPPEPGPFFANLRDNQRQLDMDGCHVGVSRQAVDEALAEITRLREALYMIATETLCPDLWREEDRKDWPEDYLAHQTALVIATAALEPATRGDGDPTPWCSYGHRTEADCDCGPIADNE